MLFNSKFGNQAVIMLRTVAKHLSHLAKVFINQLPSNEHLSTCADFIDSCKSSKSSCLAGSVNPKQSKALPLANSK